LACRVYEYNMAGMLEEGTHLNITAEPEDQLSGSRFSSFRKPSL